MQTVAMMMSDIGRSDVFAAEGHEREARSRSASSPVTTSSRSAKASISRSRNQPSDAMR